MIECCFCLLIFRESRTGAYFNGLSLNPDEAELGLSFFLPFCSFVRFVVYFPVAFDIHWLYFTPI